MFPALWIPDLFMKRVEQNGDWTLFSPNEAPGLADVYGDEFEELYTKYEKKTVVDRPSKLKNCGMLFWEPKLKQVPHLCYIKIHVTTNPTKRTWVLSNLPTCVVKLLNILLQMKLLFVTWLPLPCHHLLKMMKKYLVQL